jgi:Protein of unknown function (DUF2569)
MAKDEREGLHGIGGWLAFFLFGFSFVSPLRMIYTTYSGLYDDPQVAAILGDRWAAYQAWAWTLNTFGLAAIGYTTWRLFNRFEWLTVKITMAAIVLLSVGVTLLDLAGAVLIGQIELSLLWPEVAPDLVRGAFYATIWIAYFKLSVRVRNTYGVVSEDKTAGIFE